jgi:Repeat of unknown function (DUF5648)
MDDIWARRHGYQFEGTQCYVLPLALAASDRPKFRRLFNPTNVDHFYTASITESDNAETSFGYTFEREVCVVFASPRRGTVPLYRLNSLTIE